MFDRLDDILIRYQQIMEELNDPDVVNDQKHFRKLMKSETVFSLLSGWAVFITCLSRYGLLKK